MEQMCSSYVLVFGWAYTEACRKAGGYAYFLFYQ